MNDQGTTVGLSASRHDMLRRLKEDGHFDDMKDAYRFALALAISRDSIAPSLSDRQTIFNIGTLDPDGRIAAIVSTLIPTDNVVKTIELLAEWGVTELSRMASQGSIPFQEILRQDV